MPRQGQRHERDCPQEAPELGCNQPDVAAEFPRRSKCDFGQPFVVDPRAIAGEGIGVDAIQTLMLEGVESETDVPPQVDVGTCVSDPEEHRDDGRGNDGEAKRSGSVVQRRSRRPQAPVIGLCTSEETCDGFREVIGGRRSSIREVRVANEKGEDYPMQYGNRQQPRSTQSLVPCITFHTARLQQSWYRPEHAGKALKPQRIRSAAGVRLQER